jgi:hypothetical protein
MSLWTPSGEHPIGEEGRGQGARPATAGFGGAASGIPGGAGGPTAEGFGADEAEVEALRRQLADAPAEVVVANHCYGLFELAAVYLSQTPPRLDGARLAIDALGALVDGLGDRLGDAHPSLRDALAQLRVAYVQIASASEHAGAGDGNEAAPDPEPPDA